MRRIGDNPPAFFARKILEQPLNAGKPHEFVALSHHGEHRRRNRGSFADRRQCEVSQPAEHFRPNTPHHQRIADQAYGCGRCQLPAGEALEHNLGIARDKADCSGNEREQPLADPRSERAGRYEDKAAELWKFASRGGMNCDGAAQAFTENEQRRLASGALEQNASGFCRVFRHA